MAINLPTNKKVEENTIAFELSQPKYQIEDLIVSKEKKLELNKAINLHRYQNEIYDDWGLGSVLKNEKKMIINLYGKPGTGKTMAAHAIAKAFGQPILQVNYADIESKYVGETPKNIQAAFKQAKESNAIIFFDEADAMLSRRVTDMKSANDTSVNQTRSVLLNILNDYDKPVIFASNFINNYDPAFLRRILMHIELELPDEELRLELYKKYIPKQLPHDIDLIEVAKLSDSLSPSEITNSILLSAFASKTKGLNSVTNEEVKEAILSIKNAKKHNSQSSGEWKVVKDELISDEDLKKELNVNK